MVAYTSVVRPSAVRHRTTPEYDPSMKGQTMSSTASFIQRNDAGLSARLRVASVSVVAQANLAFAGANPASGNPTNGHMNTGWLGGFAETGCVHTTYVTKRITTGSLNEVST